MITVTLIGSTRNAWGYLLDSVSTEHTLDRADSKASYYMAGGTPPGRWAGNGAAALSLNADVDIKEKHLVELFGEGRHPVTGTRLGRAFNALAPLEVRITQAIAKAAADPKNRNLTEDEWEAVGDKIRERVTAEPEKQSVAGFEFVFSPPKSVSSWWALADPALKDEIRQAHQAAIDATIHKLETDIVRTRTGADGVAQAHVKGITAALFDHWDTREGDPQLHTHMLVSNRVQGADGKWRTIDSRWSLMPAVATASTFYDGVLMDEISARFGADWTTDDVLKSPEKYAEWLTRSGRTDTASSRHQFSIDQGTNAGSVKWQIAGIPDDLNSEFSQRSHALTQEKDRMVKEYTRKHGKPPSARTVIKLRQQATLGTRRAKQHHSLKILTTRWRSRARRIVGDTFMFSDRIRDQHLERINDFPLWSFRHDDVDDQAVKDAAEIALHELATARSTWGMRNAETAAARAVASWRFRSPEDRDTAVRRVTDLVLSQAIPLTPKNTLHTPHRFRTADGEDMFRPKARDLYTTTQVWDAEDRLLQAGRAHTGPAIDSDLVAEMLLTPTGEDARVLSPDQAAAVENILTSSRPVDCLVGPAGAGKTTSLQKFREIWEAANGPGTVRGLAPSAAAAEVLAESLGITTENTAKWLYETAKDSDDREAGTDFTLNAGDVLIIDESSLAGTVALDQLREQADEAGAKLLLVGDWAQLAAVDAGGAFGLLATDRDDVAELEQLHRFKTAWEADASKLLRLGKTSGLDPYIENGRVQHGLDETIVAEAVDAWKADESKQVGSGDATLVSLLIAPTNEMVDRLNQIARDWRIEQGLVDDTLQGAAASGVVSPGDRIVTRQNNRRLLTDHDRWVRNGDTWDVVDITAAGDIIAASGDEIVTLPRAYATDHVQLAYATTAHRSQGRTVDTAHTIVDSSASRETFYVAMTRGKLSNRAYVVTDEAGEQGDAAAHGMTRTWRETLDHVVLSRSGDLSAHESGQEEAERLGSIRQLAAEYQSITSEQLEEQYVPMLADLGLVDPEISDSPYLGPVLANMRRLAQFGEATPATLGKLMARRETETARDELAVLHYRIARHLENLREFEAYEEYIPMLDQFGIQTGTHESHKSVLTLCRALNAIEPDTNQTTEEVLREALLTVDRSNVTNLPGLLTHKIKRTHNIPDEALNPPEELRDPERTDKIAGLLDRAPVFTDPDIQLALEDRARAIQIRAELLVDEALKTGEKWIEALGKPRAGEEAEWRRRAVTVACYRDYYGVTTDEPFGRENTNGRNQERDRQIAANVFLPQSAKTVERSQAGHYAR